VLLQRGLPDELPRELPEVQLRLRLVRPRVAGHRRQPILDRLHLQESGLVQGTSVTASLAVFLDGRHWKPLNEMLNWRFLCVGGYSLCTAVRNVTGC
jgi:hypothetical protein